MVWPTSASLGGGGWATLGGGGSATTVTTTNVAVAAVVPPTVASVPVLATAAPVAALSGIVVDRTTANGQYVLRIAAHTDGVVQPVVVSEAVWAECVVDADYNSAFTPPCLTSK